mgnify:CR=1 FL=1
MSLKPLQHCIIAAGLPEFAAVTEGKGYDMTMGRTLKFPKKSIIAVGNGCNGIAN